MKRWLGLTATEMCIVGVICVILGAIFWQPLSRMIYSQPSIPGAAATP